MYLRFVVLEKDNDSKRLQGLFNAAYDLNGSGKFTHAEMNQLNDLTKWFNENLKVPNRFVRSKNPNAKGKAISWFKDSAKEHIEKMRELGELLINNGVPIKMIQVKKVGYVLYEDEFQITAVPFKETDA